MAPPNELAPAGPIPLYDHERSAPANDFRALAARPARCRYQAVVSDDYALRDGCETHSRQAA